MIDEGNFALCQAGPSIQMLFKDKIFEHLIGVFGFDLGPDVVDDVARFLEIITCSPRIEILQTILG